MNCFVSAVLFGILAIAAPGHAEFIRATYVTAPARPANVSREVGDCVFLPRESHDFGFTRDAVWAKFELVNPGPRPVKRIIHLGHLYLNDVRLFTGGTCPMSTPFTATGLDNPVGPFGTVGGWSAQVEIPGRSSRTVFLRAQSKFPVSLPIEVISRAELADRTNSLYLILLAYASFVLSLMLYNLVLSSITRERTFLYYVLTTLCLHLFTNLAQYGFIKQYVWPNAYWLHHNVFHFAHLTSVVSVTLFITNFLRSSLTTRQVKFVWTLSLLNVPLTLIGLIFDPPWVDLIMQINTTAFSLSLLKFTFGHVVRGDNRPARYFFIAWSFLILSWVINFLKISGLIPATPLSDTLILFGAATECLLLSLAIADRIRTLTDERNEARQEYQVTQARNSIFRQVSHDIRSPLSALNMVTSTLDSMPEGARVLIRQASQRINDIANSLLQQGQPVAPVEALGPIRPAEPVMLVALLDAIVSEKRLQYRERLDVRIEAELTEGYGLFAAVSARECARAVSNLIDNSVEAFLDAGRVVVRISLVKDVIRVTVADDGCGITPEVLSRLGQPGVTFGKDGRGSGLGIHHAKATAESVGGSLRIESNPGRGTLAILTLPRADAPDWFLRHLAIDLGAPVVSVDDDQSIHQIWSDRFASLAGANSVDHVRFSSLEQFEAWLAEGHRPAVTLIDYEFLRQNRTGLDLIEQLRPPGFIVLITSRFEEPWVRDRAAELQIPILPKTLAAIVPIRNDNSAC